MRCWKRESGRNERARSFADLAHGEDEDRTYKRFAKIVHPLWEGNDGAEGAPMIISGLKHWPEVKKALDEKPRKVGEIAERCGLNKAMVSFCLHCASIKCLVRESGV